MPQQKYPQGRWPPFLLQVGKNEFHQFFCSKGFLIQNERTIIVKMVLFDFQEITVDTLDGSEIRLTSTGW